MDEREIQQHIEKIEKLINSADKFNEMSFRMVLEGLVNKVGEEAEYFLVHYINDDKIDISHRLNIIRVAGYLQSPHFLIPLKKLVDTDENIHLRKEAIISISKYNDRRALNILNQTLNNLRNPLLQETINNEISKIKKNNPVFALLPRFLEGEKNLKEFQITIGILKRILTPGDAPAFVPYLSCGKPIIEEGAFEILCYTAGENLQDQLFTFFQDRIDGYIQGLQNKENDKTQSAPAEQEKARESQTENKEPDEGKEESFYLTVLRLKHYFSRFPELIDLQLENLGTQLFFIKEPRVRNMFIAILCLSQRPAAISFMGDLYEKEPQLRETIITEYAGNDAAVDLLFEKYQSTDTELKDPLIRSLLNCRQGLDYFYLHFPSLKPKEKEVIVDSLPYGSGHDFTGFFKMIFQGDQYELKTTLLGKIRNHYDFSLREVLFEPELENEFSLMEPEYLETITQLFPVVSVKLLMKKITGSDLTNSRAKKYLQKIKEIVPPGYAFVIKDKNFVTMLFNKIILFNNPDLGALFLSILKDIKTFDLQTYYNLHESLGLFTTLRERKISPSEVDELRKARKSLNDLYYEIRRIEESLKVLDRLFARDEMDFNQLADFINRHSLCVALQIQNLIQFMKEELQNASDNVLEKWIDFFQQFPMLGTHVNDALLEQINFREGHITKSLTDLYQTLPPQPYKIVIYLDNPALTAMLMEQCQELIPTVPTSVRNDEWEEGDILICDQETLKEFILNYSLPSKKLFLLMEKGANFSSYKSYNAKPLVKPFSAYRILREVLKEVFI